MEVFRIIPPETREVPVIISSPHSGTLFPPDIASELVQEKLQFPDDTDWFIDLLYDFAPEMGITMICANYNRWVIDLNRNPHNKPLYNDGRVITGLIPVTDFNGEKLYMDSEPDDREMKRRISTYYQPYHEKLASLIKEKKEKFGKVLLFDAHSIRKIVPGIRKEAFPDLIVGDNDGQTASSQLSRTVLSVLNDSDYQVEYNHPFKGGYITRHFGNPSEDIHTIQLEMSKLNYMDDSQMKIDPERFATIRSLLIKMISQLIPALQ